MLEEILYDLWYPKPDAQNIKKAWKIVEKELESGGFYQSYERKWLLLQLLNELASIEDGSNLRSFLKILKKHDKFILQALKSELAPLMFDTLLSFYSKLPLNYMKEHRLIESYLLHFRLK